MYKFKIRVPAKDDIQGIVTYYDEKALYVTDRFFKVLYTDFDVIKKIQIYSRRNIEILTFVI